MFFEILVVPDHSSLLGKRAIYQDIDRSSFVKIIGTRSHCAIIQYNDSSLQKCLWNNLLVELNTV